MTTSSTSSSTALSVAPGRTRILIVGGGYVGMYTALRLQRRLRRELKSRQVEVIVVDPRSYMTYQPFLPEAAAGSLEPRHVVVSLRRVLDRCEVLTGRVVSVDHERRVARIEPTRGGAYDLSYEIIVVAPGSVARTLPIPGLAEHGIGFKTLPEAIELRNRVLRSLEAAETLDDPVDRQAYLTFVFVGAGYAGLEGLAELQDFTRDVIDLYPRCRTQGVRWILVEGRDRVMGEINAPLAEFAARELRGRGIEIRTSTTLEEVGEDFARLSDGEVVPTRMLCWTAGVRPHPVVAELGLPLDDRGRIVVDRAMHVSDVDGVWAIGDAAAVPDPAKNGQSSPPTCQHAIRQGRTVAKNVAATLSGGRAKPFTYKTLGVFVDLGEGQAVAETLGIRWRGRIAWLLARTYHLAMMPGAKRKLRLLTDWNVQLFFGRDGAELGGLGHPPALDQTTAGGTPSEPPTIKPSDG